MFTPDGVHAVEPYLASWRPVLERYPELLMYPTMAAAASRPTWSCWSRPGCRVRGRAGRGCRRCGLAERAIRRGGHVRVGLEDWAGAGEPGNLDLLRDLVTLIERLGREPATIRDARQILGIA